MRRFLRHIRHKNFLRFPPKIVTVFFAIVIIFSASIVFLQDEQAVSQKESNLHVFTQSVKGAKEKSEESSDISRVASPKIPPSSTPTASPTVATQSVTPTISQQATSQPSYTPTPPATAQSNSSIATGHLPFLGQGDAKVTIVEYGDFQCPYCKSFQSNTLAKIKSDYIDSGKVRFAFRHLPLDFHANAQKAAEAAECANEQGKFWEYHNKLYEKQNEWVGQGSSEAVSSFISYAAEISLEQTSFRTCVESSKNAGAVDGDKSVAQGLGFNATPTFVINSQKIVGALPFETFKQVIEQELAK